MTLDLRQLNAFLIIVSAGSLGRAADMLHITQPALSRTVRRLEQLWRGLSGKDIFVENAHEDLYAALDQLVVVLRLREEPSRLTVLGDGTQAKPYVYVEYCLDGMEFGIGHAHEHVNVYNLAVDDQTSVREITDWTLDAMSEAMGIDRNAIDVQYGDSPRGWRGDVPQVKLDTRRMTALGWRPKLSSHEAVRRTIRETVEQFKDGPLS